MRRPVKFLFRFLKRLMDYSQHRSQKPAKDMADWKNEPSRLAASWKIFGLALSTTSVPTGATFCCDEDR